MVDAEEQRGDRVFTKEFMKPSFLEDFIEKYRSFPCLWQINSKHYLNYHMKSSAYSELVTLSREVNPNATVDWVKTRIRNLRTAFRKELKKWQSSKMPGKRDVYRPRLWYYDLLMFTADQEIPRQITSCLDDNQEQHGPNITRSRTDGNDEELDKVHTDLEQGYTNRNTDSSQSAELFTGPDKKKRKKKHKEEIDRETRNKEFLSLAENLLRNTTITDEYDAFGITVAAKLRKMQRNQQLLAELDINKILFSGLMGRLVEENFPTMYQVQQRHPYTTSDCSHRCPQPAPSQDTCTSPGRSSSFHGSVEDFSTDPLSIKDHCV